MPVISTITIRSMTGTGRTFGIWRGFPLNSFPKMMRRMSLLPDTYRIAAQSALCVPIPRSIINDDTDNVFYDNLFDVGVIGNNQRVVPLAFNIPVLVFDRRQEFEFSDSPSVTLDQIKIAAERLNAYTDEGNQRLGRIGFSPQWDPRFLYLGTKVHGANYREDRQDNALWDEGKIFEALRYFRSWNNDIDDGDVAQFIDRYIQSPLYNRVIERRIGFFITDLIQYSRLGSEQLERFDFRPISDSQGVLIDEDMVFIGIHKDGRNSAQAENFVRWILTEQAQRELVAHAADHNVNLFGFADGLSTIENVSVYTISEHHPWMIGRIPDISTASPVLTLPRHWDLIRNDVIQPWLQNFLDGVDQQSLENEITEWRKREEFR